MDTVFLRPGRVKALWKGHPWVHRESVARVEEGEPGGAADWVRVADEHGRLVGCGFCSPASALAVRLLLLREELLDPTALLRERIAGAQALRERLFPEPARTNAYRLVHAEGDGLPGLVVDRWGDVLVAQFATASMHRRRAELASALLELSGARSLVSRPAGYEDVEGIATTDTDFAAGEEIAEQLWVREEGLEYVVEPRHGQKTGHYADQRENRVRVGELAVGLDVLDLYAGTGGFALQALRHGARSALAVESSERAHAALEKNAARAGVGSRIEGAQADVRAVLQDLRGAGRSFGLVVVDPPNFFPRRGPEGHALKAYRELNVQALGRVAAGGLLASFCCTARLSADGLLEVLRAAAGECRRDLRVLRELSAGPDHPVLPGHPQGRYLSGYLLQVGA